LRVSGLLICRILKIKYDDDLQFDYPLPLLLQLRAGVWMSESK
jgi:hypothetical protein